jgi:hypothetical protein
MSDKITWVRPSGTEITTNGSAETIALAAANGWKPKEVAAEPTVSVETPRRGRSPKSND